MQQDSFTEYDNEEVPYSGLPEKVERPQVGDLPIQISGEMIEKPKKSEKSRLKVNEERQPTVPVKNISLPEAKFNYVTQLSNKIIKNKKEDNRKLCEEIKTLEKRVIEQQNINERNKRENLKLTKQRLEDFKVWKTQQQKATKKPQPTTTLPDPAERYKVETLKYTVQQLELTLQQKSQRLQLVTTKLSSEVSELLAPNPPIELPTGAIEEQYQDEMTRTAYPDGPIQYNYPNNVEEALSPDGRIQHGSSDGVTHIEFPADSKEAFSPNGSKVPESLPNKTTN